MDQDRQSMDQIWDTIKEINDDIAAQREETLGAFVAKYGLEPEECEQVVVTGDSGAIRWFVRKRDWGIREAADITYDNVMRDIDSIKAKQGSDHGKAQEGQV